MSSLPWVCLSLVALLSLPADAREDATERARSPAQFRSFELEDQFGKVHSMKFPGLRPVLLMLADREGFKQVGPWVEALKSRYRGKVTISGVADVSAVPRFLRSTVRNRIQKEVTHPVLLDWKGEVSDLVETTRHTVNVFVLDSRGQVVHATDGSCSEAKLRELSALLDQLLARQQH